MIGIDLRRRPPDQRLVKKLIRFDLYSCYVGLRISRDLINGVCVLLVKNDQVLLTEEVGWVEGTELAHFTFFTF